MLFTLYGYLRLLFGSFARREKNEYSKVEILDRIMGYGETLEDSPFVVKEAYSE